MDTNHQYGEHRLTDRLQEERLRPDTNPDSLEAHRQRVATYERTRTRGKRGTRVVRRPDETAPQRLARWMAEADLALRERAMASPLWDGKTRLTRKSWCARLRKLDAGRAVRVPGAGHVVIYDEPGVWAGLRG